MLTRATPPAKHNPRASGPRCTIAGATLHGLDNITVDLPTRNLVAVTGVSGSGKTSLVFGVLAASLRERRPVGCAHLDGFERFARVIDVDPAVRSVSRLATVASTVGVLDVLRKQFATTEQVGGTAVFLCSDAAAQITGTTISIDGGWTAL